jgi:H+/Cl- antiporter ClcA
MFIKYREITFGVLFGFAAVIMDTMMDASTQGRSFVSELTNYPAMVLYRVLFIVFGFILGWLLWQRNKTERDFRQLQERLDRMRQECGKRSLLMHASLQVLLTRNDLCLSQEAEELVRRAYQSSQELQNLVR